MSNYKARTKHPISGEYEEAEWLDDAMGPRQYGVRFPSTGEMIYSAEQYKIEPENHPQKDWREEFDNKLNDVIESCGLYQASWEMKQYRPIRGFQATELKSFIESLLTQQKQELVERLRKNEQAHHQCTCGNEIYCVQEAITLLTNTEI